MTHKNYTDDSFESSDDSVNFAGLLRESSAQILMLKYVAHIFMSKHIIWHKNMCGWLSQESCQIYQVIGWLEWVIRKFLWVIRTYFSYILMSHPHIWRRSHPYIFMSHPRIFFIEISNDSNESSVYFYESSAHVFLVCVCVCVRVCVCRCAYRCMRMCVCVYWNILSHQMTRVVRWLICTYLYV